MNLKRVFDIYEMIKKRIPQTYPRPKLAFYEDEDCMLDNTRTTKGEDELTVYAVVDPDTATINLPMNLTFEHINKHKEVVIKKVPITKQTDEEIANTLLHEIGHLYAGDRYGYKSKQYSDEQYCNNFASRWVRVLRKEKLL
jgi:hypothetical protein